VYKVVCCAGLWFKGSLLTQTPSISTHYSVVLCVICINCIKRGHNGDVKSIRLFQCIYVDINNILTQTYIDTYVYTYMYAYVHRNKYTPKVDHFTHYTHFQAYMHSCIHTYINAYIEGYTSNIFYKNTVQCNLLCLLYYLL
jgi:hypothetical protein